MRNKILKNYVDGTSKDGLTQGINEIFEPISNEEKYDEEIQREGYTIIKNVFLKKMCSLARKKIDTIYKKQIKEFKNEKNLKSINEQNIVRSLFAYDSFFLKFLNTKIQKNILEKNLGKKYILSLQNCPIHKAKARQYSAAWHRDLSYQHFVPSRQVAISVLVCLNKFTKENGAPYVLPHSHRFEVFPSKNYVKKFEKQIFADIGDIIIFDSLLYHRSGSNNSNQERKVIVQMYTLPFVKQQVNYVKILAGDYSNNKKYSYLLGYDSETPDSVLEWRKRRLKRFQKSKVKLWKN